MLDDIEVRNAIKITHGSEMFIYKTEKGQEKQTMLVNAKRTTDEMLAKASDSRNKGKQCLLLPLRLAFPLCRNFNAKTSHLIIPY